MEFLNVCNGSFHWLKLESSQMDCPSSLCNFLQNGDATFSIFALQLGSGGHFFGPYRSFLVEVNGNTEFYSLSVTTYWKSSNPDAVKTCLVVAHDDEKESHHALQLVVDENLIVNGDIVDFYHHGKIAVGRMGSGKIDDLRLFVNEKCPQFIKGKKFYLGRLINDRLWRLDDHEVIKVIVNLISYSMIRDEYRDFVKKNKK